MIELVNKTKRKGKVYLTLNVMPNDKAVEVMETGGILNFRAWQLTDINDSVTQDPSLLIQEISSKDVEEYKISIDAALNAKSIEVGIVQEGVVWFETLLIEL